MLVVDVVFCVFTSVPPVLVCVVLLYHSYLLIVPLPAVAVTDNWFANAVFSHVVLVVVDGFAEKVGKAFTPTLTVLVNCTLQPPAILVARILNVVAVVKLPVEKLNWPLLPCCAVPITVVPFLSW